MLEILKFSNAKIKLFFSFCFRLTLDNNKFNCVLAMLSNLVIVGHKFFAQKRMYKHVYG